MGVHCQGPCERIEGLGASEMSPQLWVGAIKDFREQSELGYSRGETRQHKVSNPQRGKAGQQRDAPGWAQDEEENLAYVVVTLEVTKIGIAAEELGDHTG